MTSRKSLQYFLTRSLQEREFHKSDKARLAQEKFKEHIVFCPAKYCKVYEVYRKEKKAEDAIDYTCCPPDIKRGVEKEELPCPCQEVSCDCKSHELTSPFHPMTISPHHRKPHHRIPRPHLGCTGPRSYPDMHHDRGYDRHYLNYSHNHHEDDFFASEIDTTEEESPYFLKDLPIPECLCQIEGCTCRDVCWDKCGVPPLFHNCGGPKSICKNIQCPNLQELLLNTTCGPTVKKRKKYNPPCVKEETYIPVTSSSMKKCLFKKRVDDSELPNPCSKHGIVH